MEFFTYRLPNGIRGIHRQVKSNVAHCALVVNAGSRDEHPDQYGLAHLTEHAFFKGTQRRRAWQVNCRLENLGGELNAFTTKEDTTIHATTLRGDFPRAAELIADIAFRSTFPERELEREKEVIADEINTYKDSPADLIYDTFEDMLFAGSELGHNILGRKCARTLRRGGDPRLHRPHAHDRPDGILVDRKLLGQNRRSRRGTLFRRAGGFGTRFRQGSPGTLRGLRKDGREAHAPDTLHHRRPRVRHRREKRLPLALLTNILGGPCANSLLNVVVREKERAVVQHRSQLHAYSDTGIVAIYFSSENGNTAQCIDLIEGELRKLRTAPLTAASCRWRKNSSSHSSPYRARATRVHAGRRKKFPDARRRGYHGTGLRQVRSH